MDQADFHLLGRLDAGQSVFRPFDNTDEAREAFQVTVQRLLLLRDRGLVRLPEGRVGRNRDGRIIVAGPCDLTPAGQEALERDRRLWPRP